MNKNTHLLELVSLRNHDGWELCFAERPNVREKDPVLSEALAKLILLVRHQIPGVQIVSNCSETIVEKLAWRLDDTLPKQEDAIMIEYNHITLRFGNTDSKRVVCIVFPRDNLADTIGECHLKSSEELFAFLTTQNNQVLVAINKFLNKIVKKRPEGFIEVKGCLVIVKDKDHPNSVHTRIVEQRSSNGCLYEISVSELLEECDDCLVLEG